MPICPACLIRLSTVRQREGVYFQCARCGGRAVTLPQIRRVTGDRFATTLLRQINQNQQSGERDCPFCGQRMRVFQAENPILELDACKPCGLVWFDAQEFERAPQGAVESTHELMLRGTEAHASHRNEVIKERASHESTPDLEWKMVPALFGFPVEAEAPELTRRPWLTWALLMAVSLVSLLAFRDLKAAVSSFGFVPADAWRGAGMTLITSFFLHGGVLHLVGNMYFLLIFGDNVEDYLGRWRYAGLLLAATLAGGLVHLLFQSHSTTPCVGASGGISGIIVFYALQFPKARLGFLFRFYWHFRWIWIPAWGALALWVLLQLLTASLQMSGASNVAATAHLGGAMAGLCAWIAWRRLDLKLRQAKEAEE